MTTHHQAAGAFVNRHPFLHAMPPRSLRVSDAANTPPDLEVPAD